MRKTEKSYDYEIVKMGLSNYTKMKWILSLRTINGDDFEAIVKMMDEALDKVRLYPKEGELYYTILKKQFFEVERGENEMLEITNLERSTFYIKKKQAIKIFTLCMGLVA